MQPGQQHVEQLDANEQHNQAAQAVDWQLIAQQPRRAHRQMRHASKILVKWSKCTGFPVKNE
jgi:hypothetical protein